jgi:thymidine phosphorylase
MDEVRDVVQRVGCVITGATATLVPADRKLYALRDVTATVESIPLIASSIMSKKIAEGTSSLVLDVKVGSGAFMSTLDRARELASTMVRLGADHGVRTSALLTAMDTPLGRAAGNALEVAESVEVLSGGGPGDVVEVTLALAREMLRLAGVGDDVDPAAALQDGRALAVWNDLIAAQGGDPSAPLPVAPHVSVVPAERAGYVQRVDARAVGVAAWRLGAGRARKEDPVSATAGVVCLAKEGDAVDAGEPVLELHADDTARFDAALDALRGGIVIGDDPPPDRPLILDRIA